MRTIQKEISLEPMTSRLPSVWPSYMSNKLYFFDEESLKNREWQYTSNWGMIPMNIVVKKVENESGVTYETCGDCTSCDLTLSFERLSKWYHFFNEYYDLLKKYGHCNRVYTSAEDYYNYESNYKYSDQMIYGTDKQTYIDLDNEFAEKGGRVEVLVFNKDTSEYERKTIAEAHDEMSGDATAIVDVYDVGFFKWICENVVPSFIIPSKYSEYWKKDILFYPDVIKWMAWFGERIDENYEENANYNEGEGGELDSWECKSQTVKDCCDCEEYFNRGGEKIYSAMTEWFGSIQEKIRTNTEIVSSNTECFAPTIILPTELQISIDDLGENSIFSEEYELGIDYRVASGLNATENTCSGTVVTMNGTSVILNSGNGYSFDETYMEKYVSTCDDCGYEGLFSTRCPKCGSKNIKQIGWSDYTEKYVRENENEFNVSAVTYFAYDDKNVKYISSAQTYEDAVKDLKKKMSKKYQLDIIDYGWILINGNLYPINEIEYATYDETNKYLGGKKYMVYREDGTNTPYTFINGEKVYAEFYPPRNKFYFPFFKTSSETNYTSCNVNTFNFNEYIHFDRYELNEDKMYYIYYDGSPYEINHDSGVTIDDDYYRISGYTVDEYENSIYYTYGTYDDDRHKLLSGETLEEIGEDVATVENSSVIVHYPLDVQIYSVDEINGRTVSKLADLRLYNVLTDDIGNNIDGIYEINNKNIYNHQPPEGKELELIYQVGNTANISRFSLTSDDIVSGTNYFVGDIITRMTFYYKEEDGTIPEETVVDVLLTESGITMDGKEVVSGYTSLSAISKSTAEKIELENHEEEVHVFHNDIFCDVTYHIGATLSRKNGENYNLSYDENKDNHGVEYKETVQFVKENREYYLKKRRKIDTIIPRMINRVSNHSISYPIYVYEMVQTLEHVDNSQYDSSYEVPMADFRFNINIFRGNTDTFSGKDDMEAHNGMNVSPVFMEEYRLGISSIENVDSNIYIDRGINAAFEKHLKLGEVTSLEALVNYGNGFFKMMEN